jgi:hypothetical protein
VSFDFSLAISALLVVVSAALLVTVKLVVRVPGKARSAGLVLVDPGRRRGPV